VDEEAKVAAPKTKKRYGTSRKRGQADLARADEVQDSLEGVWEWIRRYRYPAGIGLGALCLFVVGLDAWQQSSLESQRIESEAFSDATEILNAAIVVPGEEVPEAGMSFATEEERATEALAQIDGFAASNAGGMLEGPASLAATQALLDLERWDDALVRIQPWIDENRDADFTPILRQRAAQIALSKGDSAGARTQFEALVSASNWWHQAAGHLGLGDHQHPGFASEGADAEAARKHYDAALESLASLEKSSLAQSVRSVVQTRLSALP
jgi:predicted negative regulator of RcsB-dependent stress response